MSVIQMTPGLWTQRKSAPSIDPRIQQLDDLQRLSEEARNKFIGEDWYRTADDLYNFVLSNEIRPSYRPAVNIPQLQVMMLNEATDIAALKPKVYIFSGDEREQKREKAYQDHWRHAQFNYQILCAQLSSLFNGTGYIQIGFDPWANRGKGNVWIRFRRPKTVFPDPAAISHYNWAYVQWEDQMYIDDVRRMFNCPNLQIRGRASAPSSYSNASLMGESGYGFSLPPGPLSSGPTFMKPRTQKNEGLVTVRTSFIHDFRVVEVKEKEVEKTLRSLDNAEKEVNAKYVPMYPHGRKVVDVEGTIVFDDDNPTPTCLEARSDRGGTFPLVPVHALPNLTHPWAPPPPKISLDLQNLAGRMYTQTFENAVRLNNGTIYVDEATGLRATEVGGIPGQVLVINANSKPPQTVWPSALPQHFLSMPDLLLSKQKELFGVTPQRQGDIGKGNVAFDLFDAAIYQAEPMKRLRSQLLSYSIQDIAEISYFMMCAFMQDSQRFPSPGPGDFMMNREMEFSTWEPVDQAEIKEHEIYMDEASLRPISQMAFQKFVMGLRQGGMISNRRALEWLEIPDAKEAADEVENEERLAALAKVKRR
jgi:hypothetical protein